MVFEGDEEAGAIPVFANSLGFDLDAYGIVTIRADGKQNVSQACEMLDIFNIKNIQ